MSPPCVVIDVETDEVDVVATRVIGFQVSCGGHGSGRVPLKFEMHSVHRPHGSHDLAPIGNHSSGLANPVEIPAQANDGTGLPTGCQSRGQCDEVRVVGARSTR